MKSTRPSIPASKLKQLKRFLNIYISILLMVMLFNNKSADAQTTFNYVSNATQTYTVPPGVTSVTVQMWAAGGGSGYYGANAFPFSGGSGAYVSGILSGLTPGSTLTLYVPSGGSYDNSGASTTPGGWPNGGAGGNDYTYGEYGGGGGGYAAIAIGGTYYVVVGAGGGGGSGYSAASNFCNGGGGGATTGGQGAACIGTGAGGGTISAGGAGGTGDATGTTGSSLTGGAGGNGESGGYYGSGGGGAGYFGGGGGNAAGGGAGGGSSYPAGSFTSGGITFTLTSVIQGTANNANGTASAPGSPSPSTIGAGNYAAAGGNGQIIICPFTSTPVSITGSATDPTDANLSWTAGGNPGTSYNWYVGTVPGISTSSSTVSLTYTLGTYTWTCPAGVTSINIQAWGGGGAGGGAYATSVGAGGGGGAGGSFAQGTNVSVVPGNNYTILVGAGGTPGIAAAGGAGGSSSFNTNTVIAVGGGGGTYGNNGAGAATNGTTTGNAGTGFEAGGTGAAGSTSPTGGGGGGGAGTTAAGSSGASGGAGGTSGGGAGGAGTSGTAVPVIGNPGTAPGGGGSGAETDFNERVSGAPGGAGQVIITYNTGVVAYGTTSSTSASVSGLSNSTTYYLNVTSSGSCSTSAVGSASFTTPEPCTNPASQVVSESFGNYQSNGTQLTITFTRPATIGTGGVIIVGQATTPNSDPVYSTTYTANTVFGSGSLIGTSSYVVYNANTVAAGGQGTVTVTGLTAATKYYFTAYEYNSSGPCYLLPGIQNSVTPSGVCSPSTQAAAGSPTVGSGTTYTQVLNWTDAGYAGNGYPTDDNDGVIIVLKQGSAPTAPTTTTSYTANPTFGSGSTTAAGSYVVYAGNATTTTIQGLSANLAYYYAIYTYRSGSACYNLTSPVSGNFTTAACVTPSIPLSITGTPSGQTTANLSWSAGSTAGTPTVTYNWYVAQDSGLCGTAATVTVPFSETGSAQTWTVPAGITSINVQLWGAGGGGGEYTSSDKSSGGSGGYVSGTLAVTPGSALTIVVGKGGGVAASSAATYGGGGAGGVTAYDDAAGGGRSAIQITSGTDAVTAGGGGGAGSSKANTSGTTTNGVAYGGAGGSTTAGSSNATDNVTGATGGSQSAGGSGGVGTTGSGSAGTQYTGGKGSTAGEGGGGGGGGYYGGGGGGTYTTTYGSNGGGGGSSYVTNLTGTVVNDIGNTNSSGATAAAPFTGTNYVSGVAAGGAGGTSTAGGNGLVVITYNTGYIASGSTTGTSASVSGLTCGTPYYISINATTGCNSTTSACAGSASFTPSCCTPSAPSAFTALANGGSGTQYNVYNTTVPLSSSITGGGNCGAWLYAWSNGTNFWNGSSFSSATAVYNAAYSSINATAITSATTYTAYVEGTGGGGTSLANSPVTVNIVNLPAITAKADGNLGETIATNVAVVLTANALTSDGTCTGTLQYAWSNNNGAANSFWNGSTFTGASAAATYNASYTTITTPALTANTTFTCYENCSNANSASINSAVSATIGTCTPPTLTAKANNGQGTVDVSPGGAVELTANASGQNYCDGNGAWVYAWSNNGGAANSWWNGTDFTGASASYTNPYGDFTFTASGNGNTTYNVYAQCANNAGCASTSSSNTSVIVQVATSCAAPTLVPKVDGTGGESITSNTSVVLTANPGGGANCSGNFIYAWSNDGGTNFWNGSAFSGAATYSQADTSITVPNITSATTFTAYVQCSADNTCNGTPAPVSVTIAACSAPTLTAKADGTTGETITSNTDVALTANPSGGVHCDGNGAFEYAWYNGSHYWNGSSFGSVGAVYNTAYNNITVTGVTSTLTYSVYVICTNNFSCSNNSGVTVTVASCSAPTLTAKADGTTGETITSNTNVVLIAHPSGGSHCDGNGAFQYAWFNGTNYWTGSGFTTSTPTYNTGYDTINLIGVTSTLTYTAYVNCANNSGCSNSSAVTVTIGTCSAPALTAKGNGTASSVTITSGSTVALTANPSGGNYCDGNGSFQYAWSNGSGWWNGTNFTGTTASYSTGYSSISATNITSSTSFTVYAQCANNSGCTSNSTVTAAIFTYGVWENFENGSSNWSLGTTGRTYWEINSCSAHGGSNGLDTRDAQGTSCDFGFDEVFTDVAATRSIDLTNYTTAYISFYYRIGGDYTGSYHNFGRVYIDGTGGTNPAPVTGQGGTGYHLNSSIPMYYTASSGETTWYKDSINLSAFAGGVHTITFTMTNQNGGSSDPGYDPGFEIDDIYLSGTKPVGIIVSNPVFYNTGGSQQLAYNNSKINTTTPNFLASASATGNFNQFYIQICTDPTFASGTSWTQTFSGTYTSGTQYPLTFNNSFTPTDGTTYYVRLKGSPDGGTTYSLYSSGTYSFTYTATSGNPYWYQTTQAQYNTDALSGLTATSGSGLQLTSTGGGSAFTNPSFESTASVPACGCSAPTSWTTIGFTTNGGYANDQFGWINSSTIDATNGSNSLRFWNDGPLYECSSEAYEANDFLEVYQQINMTGISSISFDEAFTGICENNPCGDNPNSTTFYLIIDPTNSTSNYLAGTPYSVGTNSCTCSSSGANGPTTFTASGLSYTGTCTVRLVAYVNTTVLSSGAAATYYVDNLQTSSTPSGTLTSTSYDLASLQNATKWGQLQWNQTQNNGSITFTVQKCVSGTWTNEITGITSGIDGANSYDISSIPVTTSSDSIRVIASFTATVNGTSPSLNSWAITAGSLPGAPVLVNTGGTTQLAFNNSIINTTQPVFRAYTPAGGNPSLYYIEINTAPDFSGSSYTQSFSGSYTAGIANQYDFTFTNGYSPSNGTTYYVRMKASGDGGSTYSSYSSGTYSFTYQSSGNPAWYQTTQAQFNSDALAGVTASGSGVQLTTTSGGSSAFSNGGFETGSFSSWTTSVGGNLSATYNMSIVTPSTNSINGYGFTTPSPSPVTGNYGVLMSNDEYVTGPGVNATELGWYMIAQTNVNLSGVSNLTFNETMLDWTASGGGCSGLEESQSYLQVWIDANNSSTGESGTLVYGPVYLNGVCPGSQIQTGPTSVNIPISGYGANCSVKFEWHSYVVSSSVYSDFPTVYLDNIASSNTPLGTITSTAYDLGSVQGATNWSQLQWNQTLNGGTITLAVQKCVSGTWTNVTGLTSITSATDGANTYDISSIPVTTALDSIRIVATLTTTSGGTSPSLNSWMVGEVSVPTLTAEANGISGSDAECSGSTVALTANPSGGNNCSGTWQYAWYNGTNYWNGSSFGSATPVYNTSYSSISTAVSANTTFTAKVNCSASASDSAYSSVTVTAAAAPSGLTAVIGSPANGTSNHLSVSWTGGTGDSGYDLDYSTNGSTWTNLLSNNSATTYDHNTGADPNVSYYYRLKVHTGSGSGCSYIYEGGGSSPGAAIYTDCDVPAVPTIGTQGEYTLPVSITAESPTPNPSNTTYALYCTTTGQYVQANGSLGSSAVYQTAAAWGTATVTGLSATTQYCFYEIAQNGNGATVTGSGTSLSATQTFDASSALGTGGPTSSKWATTSCSGSSQITWQSSGGCTGGSGAGCVGYTTSPGDGYGCYLASPLLNCTGLSSVTMTFNLTNTASSLGDYIGFSIWSNTSSTYYPSCANCTPYVVTSVSGATLSNGNLLLNTANSCQTITLTWDLSSIPSADRGALYFYLTPEFTETSGTSFNVLFDNISVSNPIPTSCATTLAGPPLCGAYQVGPTGDFTSLTAVAAALSTRTVTCNTTFNLQSTYSSSSETFPITFSGISYGGGGPFNIAIRPDTSVSTALVTSGSSTSALITLSGVSDFILDGRPGGNGTTPYWTIQNTSTSSAGPAIELTGGSDTDTLEYLTLLSSNQTTSSGTVYLYPNTTTNSADVIQYCNIGPNGSTYPFNGICLYGNATTAINTLTQILNNDIHDFIGTTATGVIVTGTGLNTDYGDNITISGNSFYRTVTNSLSDGSLIAIDFLASPGGSGTSTGNTISNNYIGGLASARAGGQILGTWVTAANTSNSQSFMGIQADAKSVTISGNVIGGILDLFGESQSGFAGIYVPVTASGGTVSVTGNTIGSTNEAGKLDFGTSSTSLAIVSSGSATLTTQTGLGFQVGDTVRFVTTNFFSSYYEGYMEGNVTAYNSGTGSITINVVRSLFGTSTGTGWNIMLAGGCMNNGQWAMAGIWAAQSNAISIANNAIGNLANTNANSFTAVGIYSSAGTNTITGNNIYNIYGNYQTQTVNTFTATNSSFNNYSCPTGIVEASSASSTVQTVSNNTIYNLNYIGSSISAQYNISGIEVSGTTGVTHIMNANLVYGFGAPSSNSAPCFTGILLHSGSQWKVTNNLVDLGLRSDGTANTTSVLIDGILDAEAGASVQHLFYHNSIYIGGSGVSSGTVNTYCYRRFNSNSTKDEVDMRNNIFLNNRSNSSGSGKHYCINYDSNSNLSASTEDWNDCYGTGTGFTLAQVNSVDETSYSALASAAGNSNFDLHSLSSDPTLTAPTSAPPDFHLQPGSPCDATGATALLTLDYYGVTRSSATPTDLGAVALSITNSITTSNVSASYCPGGAITVNFTAAGSYSGGNVYTAQLSDATGIFSGSPVTIGTLTSTATGSLSISSNPGTLPSNATAGSLYIIRVIASSPSITGSSTTAFTIKTNVGIISVSAAVNPVCIGGTTTLTANGVTGDNAVVTWYSGTGGSGTNYGTGTTLANKGVGTYYARVTGDCGTAVEAYINVTSQVCNYTVNLFLQGYYLGSGHMSPLLHLLGAASTTAVDTVTIQLRSSETPNTVTSSYTGILQSNGSMVCSFDGSVAGNPYYLVVIHRNSVETWSGTPQTINSGGSYDFTSGSAQSYGTNGSTVNLGGGVYGIYSGDINQDGAVNAADRSALQGVLSTSYEVGVYNVNDVTGDGFVDEDDLRIVQNNAAAGITKQRP